MLQNPPLFLTMIIAVTEQNEDNIATIYHQSQTEIPPDNDISICKKKKRFPWKISENEHPKRSTFIVCWSCLLILLQCPLICTAPALIIKVITTGSALSMNLICLENHKSVWRSQPMKKRFYLANVRLIACVLFSSNIYRKLGKYFKISNIS